MRSTKVDTMSSNMTPTGAVNTAVLQIVIGDGHYLALFYKATEALAAYDDIRPGLFTVIAVEESNVIDRSFLTNTIDRYSSSDDVFRSECLEGILFTSTGCDRPSIRHDVDALLSEWQTAWTAIATREDAEPVLPPGPYYKDDKAIYQLWKIQDDVNRAFVVSAIPSMGAAAKANDRPESEGELTPTRSWDDACVSGTSHGCLGVPTPSRLYFSPSVDRPLDGLRVAVKDIYHMSGLRTSVCSRAYLDTYPAQKVTAACLETLVVKGIQIVGKTHLSSFAWREEPTECVDYQAPFNPRADGYQSPAGSSSGSGAAIASYRWLDFTIGTDTTGSGRRPALWNGSFALRPSSSVLPTAGMVPTCPPFDVPSFFGRDIGKFKTLMLNWYSRKLEPETPADAPHTIILPTDFLDIPNLEQRRMIDDFAKDLGEYLQGEVKSISIEAEWAKNPPVDETDLEEYMRDVQEHGFYYDALHCFDDFLEKYKDQHGTTPYLSPPTQRMWDIASLISQEQRDQAMERFKVFRLWFMKHIMLPKERTTLVLLPIESMEPRYRDEPPPPPIRLPRGISVLFLSPTLGSPEIVVPIGHHPYKSRITNQTEQLPIAVAILAAPDMDIRLVDLIEDFLHATGRPTKVNVGPDMFATD